MAVYNTNTDTFDNGQGLTETSLIVLKDGSVVNDDNPFPVTFDGGTASVEPYYLQVAKGNITGTTSIHKYGANFDIDSSSSQESVWSYGGLYPWIQLNTARTLYIASNSTLDIGDIIIEGLDSDYNLQTETVTMNGTTYVSTANTYKRIFRAKYEGTTVGDFTTHNQDEIFIRATSSSGSVVGHIPEQYNQTMVAGYTIPNNKTGYLQNLQLGVDPTKKGCSVVLYIREFGSNFKVKHQAYLTDGIQVVEFITPIKIPEKSDIDIVVQDAGDNNTKVTASFDLLLVDD